MKKKKHKFTLLEVLISLVLLTLLLGTLFFYYRKLSLPNTTYSLKFWHKEEERFAENRLETIFSTCNSLILDTREELLLTYTRGIDSDPLLTGIVGGALFWDEKTETLNLSIWPNPQSQLRTPNKIFTLLDHVEKQPEFSFYFPPRDPQIVVDPQEIGNSVPHRGWNTRWKKNYNTLPAMLKLKIKHHGEECLFVFDLAKSNLRPTY